MFLNKSDICPVIAAHAYRPVIHPYEVKDVNGNGDKTSGMNGRDNLSHNYCAIGGSKRYCFDYLMIYVIHS